MAQRLLGVLLATAATIPAALVLSAPAQASAGCVTRGEYAKVTRGLTSTQVDERVGAHHVNAGSGGAGAVVWTYRACDSRYLVKVTYAMPAHGSGTVYTKRWVAA